MLRTILGTPFYRGAAISLFLAGLGISATNPQLTLFLVNDLGASLPLAGLYYLTNLAAPLIGFAVGSLSDRRPDRLPLFRWGSLLGAAGWVAMAFSTQVWVPFVLNLTLLGVAGATGSVIYAVVRDELIRRPTGMDNRVMATIRVFFSVGFVLGPVLGSVFGDLLGLRAMLIATGTCSLLQMLPLARTRVRRDVAARPPRVTWAERRRRRAERRRTPQPVRARHASLRPLLVFLGLSVLAMCGDTVKFAYLPIHMERTLHTSAALRGAVISTQSLGMLVLVPIVGLLADRFSPQRLVVVGTVLGVAGNLGFYLSDHVAGLFVSMVLAAGMWATLGGLGISVAQSLHPQGVGLASSLYFSALRFSAAIGGLVGSVGVALVGIPGVFVIPAALTAVATVGLSIQVAVTARRSRAVPTVVT